MAPDMRDSPGSLATDLSMRRIYSVYLKAPGAELIWIPIFGIYDIIILILISIGNLLH